ncbi:MAG: MFS transporter [Dehalococcoidia bacterium]
MTAQVEASPAAPGAKSLPLPTTLFGRSFYYGWYIAGFGLVASMMSSGIQAYGMGAFVKPMTEELGWSRTDISFGQTLSTAVLGILGLFLGGFIDRRGGRPLVVVGAILSGLGYILFGQIHELWQYYVVRAGIQTVGQALMGALVVNIALSNWFIHRRGRAIAIAAMGNSVAAFFVPSLAAGLIDSVGWRQSWLYIGGAVWILVIPVGWLIRRRRPEDHGLEPDGGKREVRAGDRLAAQRVLADGSRWTRREAMRTPSLWLLITTFGLGGMGLGAMLLHLIPFLTDSGYSSVQAAGAFSMIGVSGLLSKPVWGLIADRIPSRFAAAAEFVLMGLGVVALLTAWTLPLVYAAIFLFGMGVGGVVTLQETVWADYFGRQTIATVRSIGMPFTIVSSAGGPVLAGLAFDFTGSYSGAFLVFIVAYALAAVLILVTPLPRHPRRASTAPPLPSVVAFAPVGDVATGAIGRRALRVAPVNGNGHGASVARGVDYMLASNRTPEARRDYMRTPGR